MNEERYKVSFWDGNAWLMSRFDDKEKAVGHLVESVGPQGYHEGEVVDSETGETVHTETR